MTLAKVAKQGRRISTDADLAMATEVAAGMKAELDDLIERRTTLEKTYEVLVDPGSSLTNELPEGLQAHHDKIVFRINSLQRELLGWAGLSSQAVLRQIDARHKSGELVKVDSVARYLNATQIMTRKYVDPRFKAQFEAESRALFQQFLQENPAAILEAGAQRREEQEVLEDG